MLRPSRLSRALLTLISAFLLTASSCGDDGSNPLDGADGGDGGDGGTTTETIPADWAGTWEVTTEVQDCVSGQVILPAITETEVLCTSTTLDVDTGSPIPITCTGGFSGNTYNSTCSGSSVIQGCNVSFEVAMSITKDNDTYSGTSTITTTFEAGGKCPAGTTCLKTVFTGVRTGPVGAGDCTGASPVPHFERKDAILELVERVVEIPR